MIIFLCMLFVPTYFSREILAVAGYQYSFRESRAIVGLIAVVLALIVLTILMLLNRRILDWRKAGGRDIEEEERYESDHGMISLTPKDKDLEN
ncbi:MAG: hypothetical protein KA831_04565 [Pyrinomonadaceae bacterium]|nr:hypothetical protein [Chloracidobacterium sp.]MBP7415905.1 hypothetical protein [Pyrinomonadaceae bacterium]